MKPRAFKIHSADNVATMIDDAPCGPVEIVGEAGAACEASQNLSRGHKIALRDIAPEESVIKYGVRIGRATRHIQRGAWVHLHNLASDLDERSGTLDVHSGAPTDTGSAYA